MYCLDAGIVQAKTLPEMPQRNGLAERCNRTLLEMAGCLLIDSGIPKMMWGAAILHATMINQELGWETRRRKLPGRAEERYKT